MFLSLLLMLATPALAQDTAQPIFADGQFTIVNENDIAPFGGVLFDASSTAFLLTMPEYYKSECDIRLNLVLGQQAASSQLEIDQLNIRLGTLSSEYNTAVTQKDLEIASLQEIVQRNSKRNHWLWGAIGFAIGAGATVAIVRTTSN